MDRFEKERETIKEALDYYLAELAKLDEKFLELDKEKILKILFDEYEKTKEFRHILHALDERFKIRRKEAIKKNKRKSKSTQIATINEKNNS